MTQRMNSHCLVFLIGGLTLGCGCAASDADSDGLSDAEEGELGTDPNDEDTDRDGLSDGDEVELGTDPLEEDSDGDGATDGEEIELGTDPLNAGGSDDCSGTTYGLGELTDIAEGDTWTVDGVTFVANSFEGSFWMQMDQGCISLGGLLRAEFDGLDCDVAEAVFHVEDYCGVGCTVAEGYNGEELVSTASNSSTGESELSVSGSPTLTAATVRSYEGRVCAITLY